MSRSPERLLLVTSNGTGLGHLTRGMAIARRLGPELEPAFLTLSAAAPVVDRLGFHVDYFPSHNAPAAEAPRRWDRRLRARLEMVLDELRPRLLVFDGAHPYDSVIAALRARRGSGLVSVWCRRAMWRPGFGAEAIYWSGEFDAVLEPGELASAYDRGLTVEHRAGAEQVAPIVYLDDEELLGRDQACRELGLDPQRPHALVALGQGRELDVAVARVLDRLSAEPALQVAALESSLSPALEVPEGVVHLQGAYPMGRFFRAFDLVVAAAGYNAFHELVAHRVPTLFVPMPRQIDDQAARARWAQAQGVGGGVEGPADPALESRLTELLDPAVRQETRERMARLPAATGAGEAARFFERLAGIGARRAAAESGHPQPAAAGSGRPRPHNAGGSVRLGPDGDRAPAPGSSRSTDRSTLSVSLDLVRRVGWRLPAIVFRRAWNRLRHPPPRAAEVAVVAIGIDDEELIEGAQDVAAVERVRPERLLVITDSLDFTALRRAGFAFEYVPSPERAQRIRAGEPYPVFARRRADAALAGRRTPRRVVELAAPW